LKGRFGDGGSRAGRIGGGSEALQELRHELGEAVQVVDQAVERAGEVRELPGELGALQLLFGELLLQALGQGLQGGATLRQVFAGDTCFGRGGLIKLVQSLGEQTSGARHGIVVIQRQAYPLERGGTFPVSIKRFAIYGIIGGTAKPETG
jgi:hypothetical protein